MKQNFLYDETGAVYNSNGKKVGRIRLCIETDDGALIKIQDKTLFRVEFRKK